MSTNFRTTRTTPGLGYWLDVFYVNSGGKNVVKVQFNLYIKTTQGEQ